MKIGELFVDLGVNAGNSLNTLTQFSIKFLAIKNMAQQMVGLFDEMFGGTARFGQGLYNQNLKLGMSVKLMQELANKEQQVGVAAGTTLNSLKAVQKANADILQGQGNIKPYQKLGIDMSRLREPQELLDEIMQKILKLEPAFQRTMLAEFGLSEDLLVLWKEQGIKIREDLLLTQKDTSLLNELEKSATALKQTFSGIFNKTVVKYAEDLTSGLKGIAHWMGENKELVSEVVKWFGILLGTKMIAAIGAWGIASLAATGPWLALAAAGSTLVSSINSIVNRDDLNNKKSLMDKINLLEKARSGAKLTSSEERDVVREILGAGHHLGKEKGELVTADEAIEFYKSKLATATKEGDVSWIDNMKEFYETMNRNIHESITNNALNGQITITDNSQTTINTSDGPDAYKKVRDEKLNNYKTELSNMEMFGTRGYAK